MAFPPLEHATDRSDVHPDLTAHGTPAQALATYHLELRAQGLCAGLSPITVPSWDTAPPARIQAAHRAVWRQIFKSERFAASQRSENPSLYCYTCKSYELKTSPHYRNQTRRIARRRNKEAQKVVGRHRSIRAWLPRVLESLPVGIDWFGRCAYDSPGTK